MEIREATIADWNIIASTSTSRGCYNVPEQTEFTYVLEHRDEILCLGGLRLLNETTAWAYLDWTEAAIDHRIVAFRVLKEYLTLLMKKLGLKRVMAAVDCDFEAAIRTVQHLGFERESIMLKFRDDKPAYLYVKLAKDGE